MNTFAIQIGLPMALRSSDGFRRSSCTFDLRSSVGRRSSSFNDRLSSCAFFSSFGGCLRSLYLRLPVEEKKAQVRNLWNISYQNIDYLLAYLYDRYHRCGVCFSLRNHRNVDHRHNAVCFLVAFGFLADHSCHDDHSHSHLLHLECAYDVCINIAIKIVIIILNTLHLFQTQIFVQQL